MTPPFPSLGACAPRRCPGRALFQFCRGHLMSLFSTRTSVCRCLARYCLLGWEVESGVSSQSSRNEPQGGSWRPRESSFPALIGPAPPQCRSMSESPEVAQAEMAVVGLLWALGQLLMTDEKCADLSWAFRALMACSPLNCHYLPQWTVPPC